MNKVKIAMLAIGRERWMFLTLLLAFTAIYTAWAYDKKHVFEATAISDSTMLNVTDREGHWCTSISIPDETQEDVVVILTIKRSK